MLWMKSKQKYIFHFVIIIIISLPRAINSMVFEFILSWKTNCASVILNICFVSIHLNRFCMAKFIFFRLSAAFEMYSVPNLVDPRSLKYIKMPQNQWSRRMIKRQTYKNLKVDSERRKANSEPPKKQTAIAEMEREREKNGKHNFDTIHVLISKFDWL